MTRDELRDLMRDRVLMFHGRDGSDESDMALATGLADVIVAEVWPEIERLQTLTAECSCGATYETYAGPEPDWAVHGAVRALNEAQAEIERLRNVIDVRRGDDTWTVAVEIPMGLPDEMRRSLFETVTAAVAEWEPADRDGWDAGVAGYPTAHERDRALRAERERDAAKADAKQWHDTYQQSANATDVFLANLLDLLPGATHIGSDAWDQIPRAVKKLTAERDALKAAVDRALHLARHSRTSQGRVENYVPAGRSHRCAGGDPMTKADACGAVAQRDRLAEAARALLFAAQDELANLKPYIDDLGAAWREVTGQTGLEEAEPGDPEVIEWSPEEWDEAVRAALDKLGLTLDQLRDQATNGSFSSVEARKLWLMIAHRERGTS
jgi:hypothetical protein